MAQPFNIEIPRNPFEFLDLNENILEKHENDGVDSPLNNQNKIDMVDMQTKFTFAKAKHLESIALNNLREHMIQQRNGALGLKEDQNTYTDGTVLNLVCAIRDDLVGKYRGDEKILGLWGYEVNNPTGKKPTIVIPRSAPKLVFLAERIIEKHEEDALDSVLDTAKVAALETQLEFAAEQLKEAIKVEKIRKRRVEERNRAFGRTKKQASTTNGTLLFYVSSIRDVLKGNFRGDEMELGLWGFKVQHTSQSPTPPAPTSANVTGVVIDSVTLQPVGGVQIQFMAASGMVETNSNAVGEYTTTIDLDSAELIDVHINHPGYQPFTEQHMVTPSEEHVFDFSIVPV